MPSLRKRVSSYFRQLSFHNEPREKRHNINENSFITKYLQGDIKLRDGPPIVHGKNPTDLPNYDLCPYRTGPESIIGCYTGPSGGCTTIQRQEKHLSMGENEIEFIDNPDDEGELADNDTLIHMTSPTTDTASSSNSQAHAQQQHQASTKLPSHWRRSSEYAFGVAHSLYDRNPITSKQNGDPIADCFGLISRKDSAVLAVADGVNWGEKACIAAKSAINASLHYLNTTLFHDSTIFNAPTSSFHPNLPSQAQFSTHHQTTKDVFIALLRAFHCAHDLILERGGMLTTLTVAVVLPVKGRSVIGACERDIEEETDDCIVDRRKSDFRAGNESRLGSLGENLRLGDDKVQQRYVCCVCNVGDTLAYVYSQRDGIRELTKGSHDINCNRDMRDALGALGPVDGHNPELSNLTLSITTVQRGDIILVASDGLTDNFDPNVCKFTVSTNSSSVATNTNTSTSSIKKKDNINQSVARKPTAETITTNSSFKDTTSSSINVQAKTSKLQEPAVVLQVPVKPPRKTKNYIAMNRESVSSRSSAERTSIASSQKSGSKTSLSMSEDVSNPLVVQFLNDNSIQNKQADSVANLKDKEGKNQSNLSDMSNINIKASATTKATNKQIIPVQKSISMKNVPTNQGKTVTKSGKSTATISQNPSSSSSMVAGFSFLRSKTLIDFRPQTSSVVTSASKHQIARNNDGIPFVTPLQRYELTLLLMEDILKRGITGREEQCVTARKLCQELYNFTISLTNAKRKTLEEDSDLYYNQQQTADKTSNAGSASGNTGGVLVELGALERKARRKRALERVQALPGKLDHVTVVACNVGMW